MASLMTQTDRDPSHRTLDATRWQAVQQRDRSADGGFVYAVKTTGVYCRPSCGARLARRENVAFYADGAAAEKAGFRACKRCKPNETSAAGQHSALIAKICRRIEQADDMPSLDTLAGMAGLSRFHFHRLFKSVTGVTPKAYAAQHRTRRVQDELGRAGTVTSAIYGAGFSSNGRFYADATHRLGMTPTDYRAGGRNAAIRFALGRCALGEILVAATDKGVCAIALGEDPDALLHDLEDRFPKAELIGGDKRFEKLVATVVGFVETPNKGLDLPLDVRGTAFQHKVWRALRDIPAGSTATYSEIAARIGHPKAVRAVAQACAANPVAIAIPCHRVVRTDGALSGYRWGIARKRVLIDNERKRTLLDNERKGRS